MLKKKYKKRNIKTRAKITNSENGQKGKALKLIKSETTEIDKLIWQIFRKTWEKKQGTKKL